jgi:vitamin B12/bleomycin/antimicrobial peptide transport system ATP-binding/permease protein
MADPAALPGGTLLGRFAALAGGYWSGPTRWRAIGATLLLLALTGAEILLLIRFNSWVGDLFNVLERRAVAELPLQCAVLAALVVGTGLQSGLHLRVRRRLQLGWRRWLTARLAADWLERGTAGPDDAAVAGHANPDGRIAEDVRVATEEAVELGGSLWQATLLLVCFGGILWELSGNPSFTLWGERFTVPGYMVWLAVLYAVVSAVAAALLGRPLVRATDRRQAAEAEFRAVLVQVRDSPPAARRGAAARLGPLFEGIAATWTRQSGSMGRLAAFNAGHGRLTTTFPVLAGLPAYLQDVVTLGGLMQSAQAFQQLAAALTWPVTSMERIATWRASAERVLALAAAPAVAPADPVPEALPARLADATVP